jgi:CTP:molybdopterin cytidylyltransferase MocA
MGGPKALVRDPDGTTWVVRTARLLAAAGCSPVVVVIGASAEQVAAELTSEPAEVVEATDWEEGMGASLRAGLTALQRLADPPHARPPVHEPGAPAKPEPGSAPHSLELLAALVVPVDVPGLTADVVRRMSAHSERRVLARAVYHEKPGHPVLLGRDHWDAVIASAAGDEGARAYLEQHQAAEIECSDLADGRDVDMLEQLPDGHRLG